MKDGTSEEVWDGVFMDIAMRAKGGGGGVKTVCVSLQQTTPA